MGRPFDTLRVPQGTRLPRRCLKCATTDHVARKTETFDYLEGADKGGMLGAGVGITLVQAFRLGPEYVLPALVGAGITVTALVLYLRSKTERVSISLPLCARCRARWHSGRRMQRALVAALAVGGALLLWGLGYKDTDIALAGAGLLALPIGVALALGLRHRMLHLAKKDSEGLMLGGVARAWLDAEAELSAPTG